MVLIDRFHGIKIKVNANDHPPPHCHVEGKGGKARYNLSARRWMESTGFTRKDLGYIEEVISRRKEEILAAWKELHGEEREN